MPRGTKLRTVMPRVFLRPLLFMVLHGSHHGLLFGFVYSARLITRSHRCNVGVSSSCVWMPWSVTWCLCGHNVTQSNAVFVQSIKPLWINPRPCAITGDLSCREHYLLHTILSVSSRLHSSRIVHPDKGTRFSSGTSNDSFLLVSRTL